MADAQPIGIVLPIVAPNGHRANTGQLPASNPSDISWKQRANCLGVDPDLFFPQRGESTSEAKAVCAQCEVRLDCLEYALGGERTFGIWGGLSVGERKRLRKTRNAARRAAAAS